MAIDVSVITPAYNAAAYLDETIASVAAQTGLQFEHIIIDDCSTDATASLMRKAAEQHPHIKLIFQDENQGQARARNRGIDDARGDYIAFLDSDDLLNGPNALANWLSSARRNSADLVLTQYRLFLDGKDPVQTVDLDQVDTREGVTIATMPTLVNYTSCWQFLMRRDFLNDGGIRFSKRLRQREDRPFFTQALIAAQSVNTIAEETILYRVHDASTMRNADAHQMALFATHLEIVDDAMRQAKADPANHDYVAANQNYYLEVIFNYWGKLLQDTDVQASPECEAFLTACRCLIWSEASITEDYATSRRRPPNYRLEMLDLMRLLFVAGHRQALFELFATRNLSLAARQALYAWLGSDAVPRAVVARRKAQADRFLRSTPLPAMTEAAIETLQPRSNTPRIVLHCGQTKTGSSALQSFFETNRFALLADHGIYYPYTGLEIGSGARAHRTSGHAGLIGNLLAGNVTALDPLLDEVAGLDHRPDMIFLSVENILSDRFWDQGRAPAKLAAALAGLDVQVIAYLRRQDDWLESMYVESITSPGLRETRDPNVFADTQRSQGLLSFSNVAQFLIDSFGAEKVTLRSYEQARATSGDTIRDFLRAIGLSACDPQSYERPDEKEQNHSTSKLAAVLIRRANAQALPRPYVSRLNARLAKLAARYPIDEKGLGFFDQTLRRSVMTGLADDNAGFYDTHLPGARRVIECDPKPLMAIKDEDLLSPELERAFDALMTKARSHAASLGLEVTRRGNRAWWALLRHLLNPVTLFRAATSSRKKRDLIEAVFIARSEWFDDRFYCDTYPDAMPYPGGPAMHYVERGAGLNYDPSGRFSTRGYRLESADVASAELNPLYHFIRWGLAEERTPGVDFLPDWEDDDPIK